MPSNLSSKAEITKRKERNKWKSLNHESLATLMTDCWIMHVANNMVQTPNKMKINKEILLPLVWCKTKLLQCQIACKEVSDQSNSKQ